MYKRKLSQKLDETTRKPIKVSSSINDPNLPFTLQIIYMIIIEMKNI